MTLAAGLCAYKMCQPSRFATGTILLLTAASLALSIAGVSLDTWSVIQINGDDVYHIGVVRGCSVPGGPCYGALHPDAAHGVDCY